MVKDSFAPEPDRRKKPYVSVDGFDFETILQQDRVCPNPVAEFVFGVRITNRSPAPQRFVLFGLRPIFCQWSDRREKWQPVVYFGANYNGFWFPKAEDCRLLEPGESVDYWQEGIFKLIKGKIWFSYFIRDGGYPRWDSLNPGIYGLTCEYYCRAVGREPNTCVSYDFEPEDVWIGKVATPQIEFLLLGAG
jgi:hypothetical protein